MDTEEEFAANKRYQNVGRKKNPNGNPNEIKNRQNKVRAYDQFEIFQHLMTYLACKRPEKMQNLIMELRKSKSRTDAQIAVYTAFDNEFTIWKTSPYVIMYLCKEYYWNCVGWHNTYLYNKSSFDRALLFCMEFSKKTTVRCGMPDQLKFKRVEIPSQKTRGNNGLFPLETRRFYENPIEWDKQITDDQKDLHVVRVE